MPLEVRRFGVGHRRPDGPPGTVGLQGQVIHSDARGVVAELAFRRNARFSPHSSPSTTWFLVIEGGGWVQVGDERTRVQAGEAVLWPAHVEHAAWTDRTQTMRSFIVEFAGDSDASAMRLLEGVARPVLPGEPASKRASRGEGRLAPRKVERAAARDPEASEGEPL
jgi:quercetin dioxygenase-like cupin family protein